MPTNPIRPDTATAAAVPRVAKHSLVSRSRDRKSGADQGPHHDPGKAEVPDDAELARTQGGGHFNPGNPIRQGRQHFTRSQPRRAEENSRQGGAGQCQKTKHDRPGPQTGWPKEGHFSAHRRQRQGLGYRPDKVDDPWPPPGGDVIV